MWFFSQSYFSFVYSSLDILQLSILLHQWVHADSNLLVLWRVFSNLRINKEDINSAQVQHSRIPLEFIKYIYWLFYFVQVAEIFSTFNHLWKPFKAKMRRLFCYCCYLFYFWHFSMKENSVCLLNLKIRFRFIRAKVDILNQQ